MEIEVKSGQCWQHTNGNKYGVLFIANAATIHPDEHPPIVVYMGINGKLWARPLSDWHRSFTLVSE